jgi:hypothetical protein
MLPFCSVCPGSRLDSLLPILAVVKIIDDHDIGYSSIDRSQREAINTANTAGGRNALARVVSRMITLISGVP